MLFAILSDIHSNLEALQAVLRFLRRKPIGHWLILGDLVGYGASPNDVLDIIRSLRPKTVIRGNHDRVASGLDDPEDFNEVAQQSAFWTRSKLRPDHLMALQRLPVGPLVWNGTFNLSHGSPFDEDTYVISDYDAYISFRETVEPILFFGHTHLPVLYRERGDGVDTFTFPPARKVRVRLRQSERYMINPGSVGQPRDRIPLASFCLFNTKHWVLMYYRIRYPIHRARQRILRAGLPEFLGYRLERGI